MPDDLYPCPWWSDDGDPCVLDAGHTGPCQRRRCDGTCDTCECDFWPFGDEDEGEDEPHEEESRDA